MTASRSREYDAIEDAWRLVYEAALRSERLTVEALVTRAGVTPYVAKLILANARVITPERLAVDAPQDAAVLRVPSADMRVIAAALEQWRAPGVSVVVTPRPPWHVAVVVGRVTPWRCGRVAIRDQSLG